MTNCHSGPEPLALVILGSEATEESGSGQARGRVYRRFFAQRAKNDRVGGCSTTSY